MNEAKELLKKGRESEQCYRHSIGAICPCCLRFMKLIDQALEEQPRIQYLYLCRARQAGKTKTMLDKIKEIKPCKIEILEPKKCPRCGAGYEPPCDWIPADEPPENPDWDKKVLVLELECDSEIPVIMTMAEVFLDEGSEAEYWKPIVLPKQSCPECGDFVKELRRVRLLFTNGVGEKPYYRCEEEEIRVFVADDQLFCTVYSPDFQGEYDEETAKAFCEIGEILEKAADSIEQLEANSEYFAKRVIYYVKVNKQLTADNAAKTARVAELEGERDSWRRVCEKIEAEKVALKKRIAELEKEKGE